MNWENKIKEFLTRSIDLFTKYYMVGKPERIEVIVYIEEGYADIILDAGEESKKLDFDLFRSAPEESERDAQRECYFENESIWTDYLIGLGGDKICIRNGLSVVADGLKKQYDANIVMEVEWR